MNVFLVNFLIGISFGFILFLLGTGLSLTMGLMRIVNLAHGALYMVGAYVGCHVAGFTGNFVLGILAAGISAGLVGFSHGNGIFAPTVQTGADTGIADHWLYLHPG